MSVLLYVGLGLVFLGVAGGMVHGVLKDSPHIAVTDTVVNSQAANIATCAKALLELSNQ